MGLAIFLILSICVMATSTGPEASFDESTGAPLNEAARSMLRRHAAAAAAPAAESSAVAAAAFDRVPAVEVAEGVWKFVLLEIELGGRRRHIVRAIGGVKFHAAVFDRTAALLKPLGARCTVLGGGRIRRNAEKRHVEVYGYSKTFGRAPGANERTAALIAEHLAGYTVEWNDRGY
ncbi:Janus/Ocnus family-domain-containing protein [Pelagophyceae sp. CCMP2097]|nr:Janus/Ocnus family-domain-containing protein [Pelagophyceae sp. CCMP2097]